MAGTQMVWGITQSRTNSCVSDHMTTHDPGPYSDPNSNPLRPLGARALPNRSLTREFVPEWGVPLVCVRTTMTLLITQ